MQCGSPSNPADHVIFGPPTCSVREAPDVARLVCSTFAAHQQVIQWQPPCVPCSLVRLHSSQAVLLP